MIKKFSSINTKEEILSLAYELWKLSADEYKSNFSNIDSPFRALYNEGMKYRRIHCTIAGEIALNVYYNGSVNSTLDRDGKILYFSALVHDIKKFHKKHSRVGARWIRENLKYFVEIDEDDLEEICCLVKHHKSSDNEYESKLLNILQYSDSESKRRETKLNDIV